MRKKEGIYDYEERLGLNHNELPAKFNTDTGEFELAKPKRAYKKKVDTIKWEPMPTFKKYYDESWSWLSERTSPLEYKVAQILARKAKAFTNSLAPLNDKTTLAELVVELQISINKVKPVLNKLFDLGVYGKWTVAGDKDYYNYWVFNPWLCFNGQNIDKGIATLFETTKLTKDMMKFTKLTDISKLLEE